MSDNAVILPNERYSDCIGFTENLQRNRANNCVHEQWNCFSNDRGQLLVYSQIDCGAKIKIDTILFIEYKINKDWSPKQTPELQKSNYPYIADGKCLFAPGYKKRYRDYIPNIYLSPLAQDSIAPKSYDSWRNFISGENFIAYYRTYGREEGLYNNGKREGLWVVEEYTVSTSYISKLQYRIDSIKPTFFFEKINYVNGKKEGVTLQYQRSFQNDDWRNNPVRSIRYTNDNVNGWLIDFSKTGLDRDSIMYNNNKVVKK